MTVVRILNGGYLHVDTKDDKLIGAITRVIPFGDRQKHEASWYIHPKHLDTVRALINRYGGTFEAQRKAAVPDSPHSALYLTESAPDFVVEAVWKALVKHCHPDVGGDPDEFITFKQAYEKLKR